MLFGALRVWACAVARSVSAVFRRCVSGSGQREDVDVDEEPGQLGKALEEDVPVDLLLVSSSSLGSRKAPSAGDASPPSTMRVAAPVRATHALPYSGASATDSTVVSVPSGTSPSVCRCASVRTESAIAAVVLMPTATSQHRMSSMRSTVRDAQGRDVVEVRGQPTGCGSLLPAEVAVGVDVADGQVGDLRDGECPQR